MFNRLKFPLIAVSFLCATQPVFADEAADVRTVVASVNGTEITIGHMIETLTELPAQYRQLPTEVLFPAILEQLIQQTVLGATAQEPMPVRVAVTLENEARSLKAGVAIAQIVESGISEEDIQAAYEDAYAGQDIGVEYNASHILVDTEQEALALLEELKAGADFATAAQQYSTGPSGPSGGALGWFQRGDMVEPFDLAVAEMEVGALAGPVQTQFGWHVIKLNETRQIEAPALEEVREELIDALGQIAVEKRIAELMETADVTRMPTDGIDPLILRDTTLLEN